VSGQVERVPPLAQRGGVGAQLLEEVAELATLAGVQWFRHDG
jgi:hypothetical protein